MLDMLRQISEDTYDKDGEERKDNVHCSFKDFQDVPLPLPQDGKNVILLCCQNVSDGVGDYGHLKSYIKWVKEIAGKHYIIQPVLSADLIAPEYEVGEEAIIINKRQRYVRNDFLELCKKEGLSPILYTPSFPNGSAGECIGIDEYEIPNLIKRSAAVFTISYHNPFSSFLENSKGVYEVTCKQLPGANPTWLKYAYQYGSMNIDTQKPNNNIYGIDIEKELPNQELLAKRLSQFDSVDGRQLAIGLLGEDLTQENAAHYLKTHKFMPGYPQTVWAAQTFILTGTLKNAQNGQLQADCDFLLPKSVVDAEEFAKYIQKVGIDAPVELVTPDGVKVFNQTPENKGNKKVRIFTGYFVSDDEYNHLYRMRTDIGLGSGDNTGAKVISSQHVPFFQYSYGGFGEFPRSALTQAIDAQAIDLEDGPLKDGLKKLKELISLQVDIQEQLNLRQLHGFQPLTISPINREKIEEQEDKYLEIIQRLVELSADPEVEKAWQYYQAILRKECCYHDHFRDILTGALYLNNPHPQANVANTPPPSLEDIAPEAYMRKHLAMMELSRNELDYLTETASMFLIDRGLTIEQLAVLKRSSPYQKGFVNKIKEQEQFSGRSYTDDEFRKYLFYAACNVIDTHQIPAPGEPLSLHCKNLRKICSGVIENVEKMGIRNPEANLKYVLKDMDFDSETYPEVFYMIFNMKENNSDVRALNVLLEHPEFQQYLDPFLLNLIYEMIQLPDNNIEPSMKDQIQEKLNRITYSEFTGYKLNYDDHQAMIQFAARHQHLSFLEHIVDRYGVSFDLLGDPEEILDMLVYTSEDIRKVLVDQLQSQRKYTLNLNMLNLLADKRLSPYSKKEKALADKLVEILAESIDFDDDSFSQYFNTIANCANDDQCGSYIIEKAMEYPHLFKNLSEDGLLNFKKFILDRRQSGKLNQAVCDKVNATLDALIQEKQEKIQHKENRKSIGSKDLPGFQKSRAAEEASWKNPLQENKTPPGSPKKKPKKQ